MTTTRDDASPSASAEVAEASSIKGVRGMRWWAVLLLALVLTAGGVAADVVRAGGLGVVFLAAYPASCVLATLLVQRRDLFVPMVQPPLLLAVSVPVAVAATGSLPASGGLVSTALAVGAPLINGFPAMAITTVVCVVIGVIRIRVQRWRRADEGAARKETVRTGPSGGSARDRGGRPRDGRPPTPDDRRGSPRTERDQAERSRRRAQERARADRDRDRAQAEQERAERDRRERERADRDRGRREPARPEPGPERRPAAQRSAPPPERAGPDAGPTRAGQPSPDRAREPRSREDRMREERLREERRLGGGPPPPGVHPVRDRPPGERPR